MLDDGMERGKVDSKEKMCFTSCFFWDFDILYFLFLMLWNMLQDFFVSLPQRQRSKVCCEAVSRETVDDLSRPVHLLQGDGVLVVHGDGGVPGDGDLYRPLLYHDRVQLFIDNILLSQGVGTSIVIESVDWVILSFDLAEHE